MADKHVASDPTLVAFESLCVLGECELSDAYRPYLGTLPPASERGFLSGGFTVPEGLTPIDYRASFRKMVARAQALIRLTCRS